MVGKKTWLVILQVCEDHVLGRCNTAKWPLSLQTAGNCSSACQSVRVTF